MRRVYLKRVSDTYMSCVHDIMWSWAYYAHHTITILLLCVRENLRHVQRVCCTCTTRVVRERGMLYDYYYIRTPRQTYSRFPMVARMNRLPFRARPAEYIIIII